MEQDNYTYYTVWVKTFESDERWYIGRFDQNTDIETAFDVVRNVLLDCGGVGSEPMDVLRIEEAFDTDFSRDYSTTPLQ